MAGPPPPNSPSVLLPPGQYDCHFPTSPRDDGMLSVPRPGGITNGLFWQAYDGQSGLVVTVNPPPGHERPDGKIMYFYPHGGDPNASSGTVILYDPATNTTTAGSYTRVGPM